MRLQTASHCVLMHLLTLTSERYISRKHLPRALSLAHLLASADHPWTSYQHARNDSLKTFQTAWGSSMSGTALISANLTGCWRAYVMWPAQALVAESVITWSI